MTTIDKDALKNAVTKRASYILENQECVSYGSRILMLMDKARND